MLNPSACRGAGEDSLVHDHLALVRRAVSELSARVPRHLLRDDLVSAGMVGLAQAARGFDLARGVPFDRYAMPRIKGALLDELRLHDWASRPVRARARHMRDAADELAARLGRQPTERETAAAMGVDVATVRSLASDLHRATVLHYEGITPTADGEGCGSGGVHGVMAPDRTTPEAELLDRERNAYLVDAVRALPERLQTVVVGCFFTNRTVQDLARELEISESRVSQLRGEALDLLRDGLNSQLDPSAVIELANPTGRVGRRKAAYYSAIAASSTCRDRLSAEPRLVQAAVA